MYREAFIIMVENSLRLPPISLLKYYYTSYARGFYVKRRLAICTVLKKAETF